MEVYTLNRTHAAHRYKQLSWLDMGRSPSRLKQVPVARLQDQGICTGVGGSRPVMHTLASTDETVTVHLRFVPS